MSKEPTLDKQLIVNEAKAILFELDKKFNVKSDIDCEIIFQIMVVVTARIIQSTTKKSNYHEILNGMYKALCLNLDIDLRKDVN